MIKLIKSGYVMKLEGRLGYFAWPTVLKIPNKGYMVAASGYRMRHIDPFGRVVASYSQDGETWTPPGVIGDTGLDNRDAGLLVIENGKILLTTFTSTKETQLAAIPYYETSSQITDLIRQYIENIPDSIYDEYLGALIAESDDGIHFSEFKNIGITSPHGPTQLKSGRIIYIGNRSEKDAPEGIWLIYSDDNGESWSNFIEIPLPDGAKNYGMYEPHAIETTDNHLLIAVRVQSKETTPEGFSLTPLTIYQIESNDGGRSFGEPRPTGIIGSPPHLYKTSKGDIILSYGRREMPMGIRAKISKDNGNTWGEEIILVDDATHLDLGYPSTTEIEENKFLTVYYRADKKGENSSVRYIIWTIEE